MELRPQGANQILQRYKTPSLVLSGMGAATRSASDGNQFHPDRVELLCPPLDLLLEQRHSDMRLGNRLSVFPRDEAIGNGIDQGTGIRGRAITQTNYQASRGRQDFHFEPRTKPRRQVVRRFDVPTRWQGKGPNHFRKQRSAPEFLGSNEEVIRWG
ncbi:MAG: hypothetical protein B9S36_02115 [Verrucomicrobiia bacterium Tous-C2TDCM]|nr:MAG: hypothetical protein B9S36_02115 [Verrucomicrobiae bacterium Tous-C2TDCM]